MGQTTVFTLFYSLLEGHPKSSEWIGWVSSAGSFGRWVWPVVSVYLYTSIGSAVWLITSAVVALLGPTVLISCWKHLYPVSRTESVIMPSAASLDEPHAESILSVAPAWTRNTTGEESLQVPEFLNIHVHSFQSLQSGHDNDNLSRSFRPASNT